MSPPHRRTRRLPVQLQGLVQEFDHVGILENQVVCLAGVGCDVEEAGRVQDVAGIDAATEGSYI